MVFLNSVTPSLHNSSHICTRAVSHNSSHYPILNLLISAKTMPQLHMFFVLFSTLVAVASAAYRCGQNGNTYFCDKKLNEMHIVMTHNSLSHKRGLFRNQSKTLVQQLQAGVRGFNFDLYPNPGTGTLWTKHGTTFQDYDPTAQIRKLVAEFRKNEYRDEVIVVQLQNGKHDGNRLGSTEVDYLVKLFGGLLIQNKEEYHKDTDLGVAIEADQRVYLVTDEVAVDEGDDDRSNFFKSADVIGENFWEWKRCKKITRRREMPLICRGHSSRCTGTTSYTRMLLMNSFCGVPDYTNEKCRLLKNAERMSTNSVFASSKFPIRLPNILMVDFFHKGDVFGAQQCLRDGNIGGNGCETCEKYE